MFKFLSYENVYDYRYIPMDFPLDDPTHSFYLTDGGVGIPDDCDIEHPDFLRALKEAREMQKKIFVEQDFSVWWIANWHRYNLNFQFALLNGLYNHDGDLVDSDTQFITLRIMESWNKPISEPPVYVQYVVLDKYSNDVRELAEQLEEADKSKRIELRQQRVKAERKIKALEHSLSSMTNTANLLKEQLQRFSPETKTRNRRAIQEDFALPYSDSTPPGYVYVVRSVSGHYKIGRTKNPHDRMQTFNVKLPFEVEYTCLIPTDDMFSLERRLHIHFKEKHVNGEWFNLDESDVAYLQSLTTKPTNQDQLD